MELRYLSCCVPAACMHAAYCHRLTGPVEEPVLHACMHACMAAGWVLCMSTQEASGTCVFDCAMRVQVYRTSYTGATADSSARKGTCLSCIVVLGRARHFHDIFLFLPRRSGTTLSMKVFAWFSCSPLGERLSFDHSVDVELQETIQRPEE